MPDIFDIQGFGALSEWGGQFASPSANQAFQNIANLGSNSVALTTRIWTDNRTGNDVKAVEGKTETDASLLAGFKAAHANGLDIVFKPNLSGLDGTISHSLAPGDVAAFFSSYKAEVVHLAGIAEQGDVGTFAIGNEMSSLSGPQYEGYWRDIISSVRSVYSGDITYAAATDEASKVSFWDDLDIIGVNTYPPLTASKEPTVGELVNAWNEVPFNPYYARAFDHQSPVDFLHSLATDHGKQVLMTEVGYRSIDGTAINPGGGSSKAPPDAAEQADAYNAFMQVWGTQGGSWLKGVQFWQWDLSNQPNETGYSPQHKPAEQVVEQYFKGNGYLPEMTTYGSAIGDIIDRGAGRDIIHGGLGHDEIFAGAGNDVIVAGPSEPGRLTSTTVTLTGYGSVVNGEAAQARLIVNGQPIDSIREFTPASHPSEYQTQTFTFDNPTQVTSLAVELVNSTPGRALHFKDISVNGVEMSPADSTNASSPGSFDLYVRMINFDTTKHQDWFFGANNDNDVVRAGAGDDYIAGGIGNDIINGGAGTDTAVFSGSIADYTISQKGTQTTVADGVTNRDGTDYLTNVEYMKFRDATLATADVGNPAGVVAAQDILGPSTSDNFAFASSTQRAAPAAAEPATQSALPLTFPETKTVELHADSTGLVSDQHDPGAGHVDIVKAPAQHDVLLV
jgi:Ca2+-binding RTX toxin-like protein